MGKIPDHIKIIYIMMLRDGCKAREIMSDKDGMLLDCACDVIGAWEGYSQAIKTRKVVSDFIRKYMILHDS